MLRLRAAAPDFHFSGLAVVSTLVTRTMRAAPHDPVVFNETGAMVDRWRKPADFKRQAIHAPVFLYGSLCVAMFRLLVPIAQGGRRRLPCLPPPAPCLLRVVTAFPVLPLGKLFFKQRQPKQPEKQRKRNNRHGYLRQAFLPFRDSHSLQSLPGCGENRNSEKRLQPARQVHYCGFLMMK